MENILGQNLQKFRLKCDMTQEEVGAKIHKTGKTYSRYETGSLKPDIDTLIQLADIYSVSLDYLTGRVNTADEILKLIPGYSAGQAIGDAILRKRATKRSKKAREQKENPSGNPEGK